MKRCFRLVGLVLVAAALRTEACSNPAALTPVAVVRVTPDSATLAMAGTMQLTATPEDASGNSLPGRAVAWQSSDGAVATVSGKGVVAAVTAGRATITATSEQKSGSATITVSTGPLVSLTVVPGAASVSQGDSLQLQAIPRDAVGDTLSGRSVVWSTSAPNVATVSAAGLVKGVGIGRVTVSATSEGKQGNAAIAVLQAPNIGQIDILNLPGDLAPGATLQLRVQFRDLNGNVFPGGPAVTWSSDNPSAATVDPMTGLVTAVAGGVATITAEATRFSPGQGPVYVLALARATETDLGDLGGGTAAAYGITNAGVVVGASATTSGNNHAFRWSVGNGMVDLGTLGGASSVALAVNGVGQVAGASTTASGAQHAFLWSSAQGMQDLGVLPGGTSSWGLAINAGGTVVGSSDDASGAIHAVRWSAAGVIEQLGADTAQAYGINDGEQVVGTAFFSSTECSTSGCDVVSIPFAFSWTAAAGLVDLHLGSFSDAVAINSRGDIVGDLQDGANGVTTTAYLRSAAGSFQLLAFLQGGYYGVARAVNTNGQAAGIAGSASWTSHPVFWPDPNTVDLLSVSSGAASGVNDLQQIVGTVNDNGRPRAKLWTVSSPAPSKPRAGAVTSRRRTP
ncbi:MAG TPA: Ig-like domain-containing protein [Gemmatimonadales bacterium]|nr:Ig-like domain-containing protein [Gemmatimonadales bacterium]